MDIDHAAAVILAWPDLRVRAELLYWLTDLGIPRDRIIVHAAGGRDQASGWNASMRIALDMPPGIDHFIFAENDIRPHAERTRPMIDTAADVVGACFDNGNPNSFKHSNEIHLALWRTTRRVLNSIAPPWFVRDLDADGIERACLCWAWNKRLLDARFTVTAVGFAYHTPRCKQPADRR